MVSVIQKWGLEFVEWTKDYRRQTTDYRLGIYLFFNSRIRGYFIRALAIFYSRISGYFIRELAAILFVHYRYFIRALAIFYSRISGLINEKLIRIIILEFANSLICEFIFDL